MVILTVTFSYYCVTNDPNVQWFKITTYYCISPVVGQDFRKDTASLVCLCSDMSWVRMETIEQLGLEELGGTRQLALPLHLVNLGFYKHSSFSEVRLLTSHSRASRGQKRDISLLKGQASNWPSVTSAVLNRSR